jgi:hypothetical protein
LLIIIFCFIIFQEEVRQEENDKLRKEFAKFANAFYHWLTDSR